MRYTTTVLCIAVVVCTYGTHGGTIRENFAKFTKQVFSWGQAQLPERNGDGGGASTTSATKIANGTSSPLHHHHHHHLNDMSSPATAAEEATTPSTTLNSEEILVLKRLCPELADVPNVEEYRYNADSSKCQKLGYRQACGKNMIFYVKNGIYGECGCKPSRRLIIPHHLSNQCYEIFSQGFCSQGQWVDISSTLSPICRDNPCASRGNNWVVFEGSCVELGKQGASCAEQYVVEFQWATRRPACISLATIGSAIGVPSVKCPPGTFRGAHGKCVPPFDFDNVDY